MKKHIFTLFGIVIVVLSFTTTSFANPYFEFASKVMGQILKKVPREPNRVIAYVGWEAEREAAIKTILAEKSYDPHIVASVRENLATPQKALRLIEGTDMAVILSRQNAQWEDILKSFMAAESAVANHAPVVKIIEGELGSLVTQTAAHDHLLQYYKQEISRVLEGLRDHPGKVPGIEEINGALKELEHAFSGAQQVKNISPQARGEIEILLNEANAKLQQGVRRLRKIFPEGGDSSAVESYLQSLTELNQLMGGYSFSLVSNHIVGIELDFLLAQVRFGALENQKVAFHQLLRHFSGAQVAGVPEILPAKVLRELFSTKNNRFREYVVEHFKKTALVSPQMAVALDTELMRSRLFFPGDKEFERSIETLVALLCYRGEAELEGVLSLSTKTAAQKIGFIRSLGHLNTPQAFKILGTTLFRLDSSDTELFKAVVSELLLCARTDVARQETLVKALTSLAKTSNEETLVQIIIAFSKLSWSEDIALVMRPYLANPILEVHTAAAVALAQGQEPGILFELVRLVEMPKLPISDEVKILLLNQLRTSFSDLASLKNMLWRMVEKEAMAVRLEALSCLAKTKDLKAAQELLVLFEEVSLGSQKRRILIELATNYDHKEVLRETVKKVVCFYEDSRFGFDIFDIALEDVALGQRFGLLKGDLKTIAFLKPLENSNNPGVKEFASTVLDAIQ